MAIETFNLAAPPNFLGLDPYKPITVYHRHLPHWRQDGATYFVTFRLGDALSSNAWRRWVDPTWDAAGWRFVDQ